MANDRNDTRNDEAMSDVNDDDVVGRADDVDEEFDEADDDMDDAGDGDAEEADEE